MQKQTQCNNNSDSIRARLAQIILNQVKNGL